MRPSVVLVLVALLGWRGGRAAPQLTVLLSGMSWLENLCPDPPSGSLLVAALNGTIYKVTPASNRAGAAPYVATPYVATPWVTGFRTVLGIARDPSLPGQFYFVGARPGPAAGAGAPGIFRASSVDVGGNAALVARTPLLGNGLAVHNATGVVYTAAEGDFRPPGLQGNGSVYQVDPRSGAVRTLTAAMWAADGLYIDQERHLLYVGELPTTRVWVWDIHPSLTVPRFVGALPGLAKGSLLDDFCLSPAGDAVLGCDWDAGAIVHFPALPANGSFPPTPLAARSLGIRYPTSARWGQGGAFPPSALFVTEGHPTDVPPLHGRHGRLLRLDFP
jgi:hypothetical protein